MILWPTQRCIFHSSSPTPVLSTSKAAAPLESLIPADTRPLGVDNKFARNLYSGLHLWGNFSRCGASDCDLQWLWQHDICWQSSDLGGAGTLAKTAEAHRWQLGPSGATPHGAPAWWQARRTLRCSQEESSGGGLRAGLRGGPEVAEEIASAEYRHQQWSLSGDPISNSLASLASLLARESSQL